MPRLVISIGVHPQQRHVTYKLINKLTHGYLQLQVKVGLYLNNIMFIEQLKVMNPEEHDDDALVLAREQLLDILEKGKPTNKRFKN